MKGWLDKYQNGGELDESALSGVKNVLSAVSDVTSAPARGLTYLATGKYQDPSQAMGITNPIGAFLTDAILDPANLVGAGLATKVLKGAGKVNKVARAVDVADRIANTNTFQRMGIAPKNIPINPKQFKQASQSTIDALTQRGQELDRITNGKFNVTPDDIHYHGTFAARPIVEVKTPHGSEYFYKSTGWGGKKEIDPGQWQAFGQWMDAPAGTVKPTAVNNWFVKGKGFDNFYGSKSFGNVANSLDDVLIKKYGLPPEDINKFLNFQNIQSNVNTFIPKRKDGGLIEYNDGGPVQPNYNDASVTLSDNFVGEGIINGPNWKSPAWGGQFKDGGNLSFIKDPKLRNILEGYKPGFLETVGDYRLPEGQIIPLRDPSTEVSISVGGGDGEPAYLIPSFKYGQPLQDPVQEFNMTEQYLGGPFKTVDDAETFRELRHQYVEKGQPLPSPIATANMAMGGSIGGATQGIPGATGFMYARTGSIPSNGKYAKKTKASAQNGAEMKFYQEGLDFKPKSISRNGSVIKDDRGQWDHPGEITEIGSNQITMQGVPYPVLGISDTGDTQMMYPDQEYQYDGESVTEYPIMKQGGQLTKLDQLFNFTNYNTKQPGENWLDKYQ